MKTSAAGKALVKQAEGLRLQAYQCPRGIWTIGWGHTGPEVRKGLTWTTAQAESALADDLVWAEDAVTQAVTGALTQNQFDALVSFTFNLGAGALRRSTLLRKLNSGDAAGAADEFLKWTKAGGRVLAGLVARRAAERKVFLGQK